MNRKTANPETSILQCGFTYGRMNVPRNRIARKIGDEQLKTTINVVYTAQLARIEKIGLAGRGCNLGFLAVSLVVSNPRSAGQFIFNKERGIS